MFNSRSALLVSTFMFLFLPFLSVAQSVCPSLSFGSTGASVTSLQKILRDSYIDFPIPTGYFGRLTEAALKQWQKEHGVEAMGIVGPKTAKAMGLCATSTASTSATTQVSVSDTSTSSSDPVITQTLSRGMRGNEVALLQRFLIQQGDLQAGSDTGYFGALTEAAVQRYQARSNIVSSGSAAVTGYGVFGVRSRAAMIRARQAQKSQGSSKSSPDSMRVQGRPVSSTASSSTLPRTEGGAGAAGGGTSAPSPVQTGSPPTLSGTRVVTKNLLSDYGGVTQETIARAIADARTHFVSNVGTTYVIQIPEGTFDITAIPPGTTPKGSIDVSNINPGPAGRFIIEGAGPDRTTLITRDDKIDGESIFGIYGRNVYRTSFVGLHFKPPLYKVSQGHVVSVAKGKVVLDIDPGFPSPMDIFEPTWEPGKLIRRFLKQFTDSAADPRIVEEAQGNKQAPWLSATPVSGFPGRWELQLVQSNLTPNYPVGGLVGIKSKHGGTAYWFCVGSDITFDRVKWTHEARGVFRCGVNNVTIKNSSIERAPAINGRALALSTPSGGPQIGQPNDPPSSGHIVENNRFHAAGDNAVAFFNATGIIRNNTIIDTFSPGILLYLSPNVILENNTILGTAVMRQEAHCVFPAGDDGEVVLFRESVTAYQSPVVPYGQQCVSQRRECFIQGLQGTYAYSSCAVSPDAPCTFNGQNVTSGISVTAYQSTTVPNGSSCASEQRTCTNASLSGSYQYASCATDAPTAAAFQPVNVPLTSWGSLGATFTNNASVGAWELLENSALIAHQAVLSSVPAGLTSSDTLRMTVLVKPKEGNPRPTVRLLMRNNENATNSGNLMRCSLAGSGNVILSRQGVESADLAASVSAQDGWYVCKLEAKLDSLSGTQLRFFVQLEDSVGAVTYQGDGVSGVLVKEILIERKPGVVTSASTAASTNLASALAALESALAVLIEKLR